jgi:hypothetical protein
MNGFLECRVRFALVVVAAGLAGCATPYVGNNIREVTASGYPRVAAPAPVQLFFAFQTKGVSNAKATDLLRDQVRQTVSASGLFSTVSFEPVSSRALLSITLNNVPVTNTGDAAAKGALAGLTLGLAGTTVVDGYVCNLEYQAAPAAAKIVKTTENAIFTNVGAKGAPAGATKAASLLDAVKSVARNTVSNGLVQVASDPGFSR